jgi:cell division protease FtsH
MMLLWLTRDKAGLGGAAEHVTYTDLVRAVDEGRVKEAELKPTEVVARLKDTEKKPSSIVTERIPNMDEQVLLKDMQEHGVVVVGKPESGGIVAILLGIAPFVLLPLAFLALSGSMGRRGKAMSESRAKVYDRSKENSVRFADVAGADEAKGELEELVSFLKDPARYRVLGARAPKGVLLVGPPGTGKTLLARAVAGEAGVAFYSMSASEFVELFVGVGASRVRDLFQEAKQKAPSIIFIDELDAIGKSRAGGTGFVANEEREQTLNQLLVEMDGFDPSSGIVVLAATNRPEILDKALLRAGRFDRQVIVDRPDVRGREAILRVHAAKVKIADGVDLRKVAQRTPGMVGADLANIVNEAALATVRRKAVSVELRDFEEAIDRIQLGLRKHGMVMTEEEKRRVAFHEAGHALVALSVASADPVHRVTIIPRSIGALGATLQLPTEDRYMMTRTELTDQLSVLFGGRAAEEIVFSDVSTGAQNDLERASALARQMVTRFGMSDVLGAQTLGGGAGPHAWGGMFDGAGERAFSEETSRIIDSEVKGLLLDGLEHARAVLRGRRKTLGALAAELLERETLEREDLEKIVESHLDEKASSQISMVRSA